MLKHRVKYRIKHAFVGASAVSIAYVSPFPYIILLAVMLVVIAVCFYRFPSLRSIRKPRNLLAYLIMILLLGSVAYQVYDASLGVSIVTYGVNFGDDEFVVGQVFELEVFCENLGMRETSFCLTLTCINASFTVGSQQNYFQVNNTALKIPFHFVPASIYAKETKPVLVIIDGSASGFQLDLESPVIATGGVIEVQGQWKETANGYAVTTKLGPCV